MAGSMGPLGGDLVGHGPITSPEAGQVFEEQARALVQAGVDLLILETFSNTEELLIAIRAISGSGRRAHCGADDGRREPGDHLRRAHRPRHHANRPGGSRCRRGSQLLRRTIGHAQQPGVDPPGHGQADFRPAERRHAPAGRGPPALYVHPRVHGRIRETLLRDGGPDYRRLLRHDARAHQGNRAGRPLHQQSGGSECRLGRGRGPPGGQTHPARAAAAGRPGRASGPSWRRGSPLRWWKSPRRVASM